MVLFKTTYVCVSHSFIRPEVVTYLVVDNNDCGGIWEVVGMNCHRCGEDFDPDDLNDDCYCLGCAE